jgi:para-nitrobenzyl esterase
VESAVSPSRAAAALDLYPLTPGADNRAVLVSLMTDIAFTCPAHKLAAAVARAGSPTWVYDFMRHPSCTPPHAHDPGAAHSFEISYVFDNIAEMTALANAQPNARTCVLATEDLALAKTVSSLWGAFARDRKAVASWPQYAPLRQQVAKLDIGLELDAVDTDSGYRRRQCQVLDQVGLVFEDFLAMLLAVRKCG